jgi:hypothetical protein
MPGIVKIEEPWGRGPRQEEARREAAHDKRIRTTHGTPNLTEVRIDVP